MGLKPAVLNKDGDLTILKDLYGGKAEISSLSEELTIAAAATTTATVAVFPAGSISLGIGYRVKNAITCTSTFDIGVTGAATRFKSGVSKAAGTSGVGVAVNAETADKAILITPDTTPSDATGKLIITIYFIKFTAPNRSQKS